MRFTLFNRWGTQIGVINDVVSAVHKDELNGEDSLTLTLASCNLVKGNRIVWRDKFGVWHEHIVNDLRDVHEEGRMLTQAYCETSLAEMFSDYIEELRPYNVSATVALQRALSVTRWQIGTVDVPGTGSVSFYHISSREALTLITENWGGELSATIEINGAQVSKRSVNITSRGSDYGKRFEWRKDLRGITREVSTEDVCTALYGYGKGLEAYDEDGNPTGGYERKLTFGEINGGLDYVADEDAKQIWGLPDGKGGKKHAFGKVEFPDCEDMGELLTLTRAELQKRKEPQVSYSASVIDLADAGYEFEDVRTGDTVAIIDRELGERLTGRVLCVERDLFNESETIITLGNIARTIHDVIADQLSAIGTLRDHSASWDGAASISESYINRVINVWNATMNALGGYAYYEPGEGIIVYDKPEDQNPTQAIQLKGAGFRVANSKKSNGDWDWRTFGTGDGFTADLLNVGTIRGGANYWDLETGELMFVHGGIYDFSGNNYWNLDTGEFRLSPGAALGESTVQDVLDGIAATITSVDVEYAQNQSDTVAPTSGWSTTAPAWRDGYCIWSRTATTNANGTTYSDPACISGADGEDGVGISSTTTTYGTSSSGNTQPTTWQVNAPSVGQGQWLWVKTVYAYTDGSEKTIYSKSYVGTDGQDGKSVYVQSSSKSNGITTVVLTDGTNTNTITIADGEDGTNGTAGANGYVHIAWATSADGSQGFSTSVSTGKTHIGVYTDNTQADSNNYRDYSWSLIKGADGEDGVGISSIVEQYYLSSSDTKQTGGSWSNDQPAWSAGKHIWTRSVITWDTNPETTTTTTPTLAKALTQANQQAKAASDAVTNLSTQEAIFNLLTNDGALEGLYMHNGKLYMNASYILSGILKVGGANNANGILQVLDSSGNVISTLDKDGANIKGSVTLDFPYDVGTGKATSNSNRIVTTNDYVVTADSTQYWNITGGISGGGTRYIPGLKVSRKSHSDEEKSYIMLVPYGGDYNTSGSYYWDSIISKHSLVIQGAFEEPLGKSFIRMLPNNIEMMISDNVPIGYTDYEPQISISRTRILLRPYGSTNAGVKVTSSGTSVTGGFTASGTKSRVVATDDYDERLLYCYETPTPLFGDLGSATIGEDGLCFVQIDPIFSETARTDYAYQVFLQKCGNGDLWVSEKEADYFVVSGTPGLAFDWEVKARQKGFEELRLENSSLEDAIGEPSDVLTPEACYAEELGFVGIIESLYEDVA